MTSTAPPIAVEHLDHAFGEGALRRSVLSDISVEIHPGEIVILTGPSGSGKTTLLTLIGALRSAQSGSLRVLGQELRGADEARLAAVRRRIGYVFQAHNLLEALTASQNVQMALELDVAGEAERERLVQEALASVGLGDRAGAHPSELSGGQRQRVAIARALARRPDIILADEPTASLDRETGRSVVELLERLARRDGTTVVLVTHDSRILDVADRILTLEDGRLQSLMSAVASDARHGLRLLVRDIRRGALVEHVAALDTRAFGDLLHEVTEETRHLLGIVDQVQGDAFGNLLEQVVQAFSRKVSEMLRADDATLRFFDDPQRPLPPEAEATPGVAAEAGATRLVLPVVDRHGRAFGVVEVAGPQQRERFDREDEHLLQEVTSSLGLILESWWRMSCACRAAEASRTCPCCNEPWHVAEPHVEALGSR